MSDNDRISAAHAVSARRLQIVLGIKYRRTAFTPALREALRAAFAEILADGRGIAPITWDVSVAPRLRG